MNAVQPSQALGKPSSCEKQEHASHPSHSTRSRTPRREEHTVSDCWLHPTQKLPQVQTWRMWVILKGKSFLQTLWDSPLGCPPTTPVRYPDSHGTTMFLHKGHVKLGSSPIPNYCSPKSTLGPGCQSGF